MYIPANSSSYSPGMCYWTGKSTAQAQFQLETPAWTCCLSTNHNSWKPAKPGDWKKPKTDTISEKGGEITPAAAGTFVW